MDAVKIINDKILTTTQVTQEIKHGEEVISTIINSFRIDQIQRIRVKKQIIDNGMKPQTIFLAISLFNTDVNITFFDVPNDSTIFGTLIELTTLIHGVNRR